MSDVFAIESLWLALGVLPVGVIIAELIAIPRPQGPVEAIRRALWALVPCGLVFAACIGVSARPLLSVIFTLVQAFAITAISNVKARVLREPLVYTDVALLGQVLIHPRLYIDYIGWGPVLAMMIVLPGATGFGFWLEAPIWPQSSIVDLVPSVVALGLVFYLAWTFIRAKSPAVLLAPVRALKLSTDIHTDLNRFGLFWTMLLYAVLSGDKRPASVRPPTSSSTAPCEDADRPHIIAIQCESFFDVRRLHPEINPALLPHFDACVAESEYYGRLKVPAWGANTIRTEFSFLTGIANDSLSVHRYNPFLHIAKTPIDSIAWQLKAKGYRTICVHPYQASFFERNVVYPSLGFDVFLDIDDFEGAATFGPYIADLEISAKIQDLLKATDQPLFIFAITMENHGKWEESRFEGIANIESELPRMSTLDDREFSIYLRHLANADAMIGELMSHAGMENDDERIVCLFGDHQPSFPDIFKKLELKDESTDYVIWTGSGGNSVEQDASVEELIGKLYRLSQ